METLTACPICKSDNIRLFAHLGAGPTVTTDLWGFRGLALAVLTRYSYCEGCFMIFQNPRPLPKELTDWYESGTYRQSLGMTVDQIDKDEMARARRVSILLGTQYSAHLDVGCSRGYLLDLVDAPLKKGVDLNPSWTTAVVQVEPRVDSYFAEQFDLVTIVHTLEHEYDPVSMLKDVHSAMRHGGTLYIEVPGNTKDGLRLPHLYYFTVPSLQNVAKTAGFGTGEVQYIEPNLGIIFKKE